MVKINGIELYNDMIVPNYSANSPDDIMEDKTVATDNNVIRPMTLSFSLYYINKDENDDYRDTRKKLEDLYYSPETLITIEDITGGIIYENMMIQTLNGFVMYQNGFECKISLKQALLTVKAEAGANNNRPKRNVKYQEKPLKTVNVNSKYLPDISISALSEMGVTSDSLGNFSLKCLDFGSLKDNISSSILTNLGGNKLNFELIGNSLDILNKSGEYLAAGQRLLGNVELLANLIPGVDFTMKLLPMTQSAIIDKVFDIASVGTEWQMVVNQIKGEVDKLGI